MLMEGIEKEATVIRKSEPAVQTGETGHYRICCYFTYTPVRNFELFYVELDAHSSNATIGHTYINEKDTLLTFMVINYYPS